MRSSSSVFFLTSSVAISVKMSPQAMVVSSTFLDFGRLLRLSDPHKKAKVGCCNLLVRTSLHDCIDLSKHLTFLGKLIPLIDSNTGCA